MAEPPALLEVPREALAALRLFAQAATKEEATAELARRVVGYLAKARCQPELRFEGCEAYRASQGIASQGDFGEPGGNRAARRIQSVAFQLQNLDPLGLGAYRLELEGAFHRDSGKSIGKHKLFALGAQRRVAGRVFIAIGIDDAPTVILEVAVDSKICHKKRAGDREA